MYMFVCTFDVDRDPIDVFLFVFWYVVHDMPLYAIRWRVSIVGEFSLQAMRYMMCSSRTRVRPFNVTLKGGDDFLMSTQRYIFMCMQAHKSHLMVWNEPPKVECAGLFDIVSFGHGLGSPLPPVLLACCRHNNAPCVLCTRGEKGNRCNSYTPPLYYFPYFAHWVCVHIHVYKCICDIGIICRHPLTNVFQSDVQMVGI